MAQAFTFRAFGAETQSFRTVSTASGTDFIASKPSLYNTLTEHYPFPSHFEQIQAIPDNCRQYKEELCRETGVGAQGG
jgi:hypothetical protein